MSKANGQAAKRSFSGHALMENRNGQRLRRLARVVLALLAAGDVVLQQAFAILVNVVGSMLAANLSMSRNQRNSRL
jgi:hypothetical protein